MKTIHLLQILAVLIMGFNAQGAERKDVALRPGDIHPNKEKADRLENIARELSKYVKERSDYNPLSTSGGRKACKMRYDEPYSISVTVFGVTTPSGIDEVTQKCVSLFKDTNVKRVYLQFFRREVEKKEGRSTRYVPTGRISVRRISIEE